MFVALSLFSFSTDNLSSHALQTNASATVIASSCELYESADFKSNKILITIEQQNVPYKLYHRDIVEVILQDGDFVKVFTQDEIEGFVYKYYLTQNTSQTIYPVFNATIRNSTYICDMDYEEKYPLAEGTRVFVYKSFSEKKGYTAVQTVLNDQTIYNGYVRTKDVNPDGVSGLLIAGISIIAAAVTVILSIVFIKKKKKKKK